GAAEQLGQIDLQALDTADGRASNGGRFVLGKHDSVLWTNAAARRTAFLAVVLLIDQDSLLVIDAVNTEETKVDALHAIGTAAVIDDGMPAAAGRLQQLLR